MNMKEKIQSYIKDWESKCYYNGLPDEVPNEISSMVPSYKRICIAIMKNDVNLESLGYSRPVCKAYSELKRIEISQRHSKHAKQLSLW